VICTFVFLNIPPILLLNSTGLLTACTGIFTALVILPSVIDDVAVVDEADAFIAFRWVELWTLVFVVFFLLLSLLVFLCLFLLFVLLAVSGNNVGKVEASRILHAERHSVQTQHSTARHNRVLHSTERCNAACTGDLSFCRNADVVVRKL
jgi:hypothetical protein